MKQSDQQGWLENEKSLEEFLAYIPEEESRDKLRRYWFGGAKQTPEHRYLMALSQQCFVSVLTTGLFVDGNSSRVK